MICPDPISSLNIIYSLPLSPIPFYACCIDLLAGPPIGWVRRCLHWLFPGLGMLLPQIVTLLPLDEASPTHHLYNCSILPNPYSAVSPRHLLVSNIVCNLLFMLIVYLPPLRSVRKGGFVFSSSMYRIAWTVPTRSRHLVNVKWVNEYKILKKMENSVWSMMPQHEKVNGLFYLYKCSLSLEWDQQLPQVWKTCCLGTERDILLWDILDFPLSLYIPSSIKNSNENK